jgi:hypothetical protein
MNQTSQNLPKISQKDAQKQSAKNSKNSELNRTNKVVEDIQKAIDEGLFVTESMVYSASELKIIKDYLKAQKYGAVWSKINDNLYLIKIYWGPNPRLKGISDANTEESWKILEWITNTKSAPVVDPKTGKPAFGRKWNNF